VPTRIDSELHEFKKFSFRYRPATSQPARLLVMIHGWTGSEDSMWIFASRLPNQVAVLAPRGPFPAKEGGYSWREIRSEKASLPDIKALRPSAKLLIQFIDDWSNGQGLKVDQFGLIGFSQGTALCYTLALLYPNRVRVFAALSGFLPGGSEKLLSKSISRKGYLYCSW
jgi:phospholipase/carboxylesterase